MCKQLWNEKEAKTVDWALVSGLLLCFAGIIGLCWEDAEAIFRAILSCFALKTPV